ncbi:MAG: flagellar biosynthetic protein FliO [Peptococcaceae bacterium]|jgi:flagellar protein FliO/FliZ|nr:flagellar biosynthetic protein FliO [Peptococcaceae bacterium]
MPNNIDNIENQPYNPEVISPATPEPFSWVGLIGTVLVFLLILVVVLWLIRRLNRYTLHNMQTSWARVLDRQPLGTQQSLYLVEIAGKIKVLGVTDHQINVLTEISEPEIVAEILEEIATRPEEKLDRFMNGLWRRVGRKRRKDNFSAELERLLKEEIR